MDEQTVTLAAFTDTWSEDDRDANFKREVAEYTRADPLPTFRQLSANTGIPVGALVRYALVRWTAEGSEALMAMGPRLVERLWAVAEKAEAADTPQARLEAYETLRQMIAWLRLPLEERPEGG